MRNENAAGTVGVRDGEGEVMSLQSRFAECGEGESRRKLSEGDLGARRCLDQCGQLKKSKIFLKANCENAQNIMQITGVLLIDKLRKICRFSV